MTSAWVDIAFNGGDAGPPDGPTVEVEVVGLARSPADFGRWSGVIHLTPAYAARHQDQVHAYTDPGGLRAHERRRVARPARGEQRRGATIVVRMVTGHGGRPADHRRRPAARGGCERPGRRHRHRR